MSDDRRAGVATALTGAALLGGGAQVRAAGVRQARAARRLDEGEARHLPVRHVLLAPSARGGGKARALYALGTLGVTAGGAGLAAGVHQARRPPTKPVRKDLLTAPASFLVSGVQGTEDALRHKVARSDADHSLRAKLAGYGAPAASAAGAGYGVDRLIRHARPATRLKPAAVALGAAGGAYAAGPATRRVVEHVAPGYTLTTAGVRRKPKGHRAPAKPVAKTLTAREHLELRRRHQQALALTTLAAHQVGKASVRLPHPRVKGYRASALVRRAQPTGTIRVFRRAAGVA